MRSDEQIAREIILRPIHEIASIVGLEDALIARGPYMAKVPLKKLEQLEGQGAKDGKLILVTAMTPTAMGEGKTTNTIGLSQALKKLGKSVMTAIREPSLGPCMGVKGGAAGGGYSQVLPMDEINLHFTGDLHAVTSAHNLLSAMIDNHIHRRKTPEIHPRKVYWKRVMDMNDRSLREIIIGLGSGGTNGTMREDGFEITASSEVMAALCLAGNLQDLKDRLARIVVGETLDKQLVLAGDLKAQGAMTALLREAIYPNLVQSIEGVPVLVHGGPFANIAHGCNSLTATKLALKVSDYTVTEAGFASDLGAEKFFNIKCRTGGITPSAAVLVVTLRAYKNHGIENIMKHIENLRMHNLPALVSINRFLDDNPSELQALKEELEQRAVPVEITDFRESGGAGGVELAQRVIEECEQPSSFSPLYPLDMPLKEKIETISKRVYGAADVVFAKGMLAKLKRIEENGYGNLPVCMAKTQTSLTDNPKTAGCPKDFSITVRDAAVRSGAGFVVVYTGDIMTMPGLPISPAAEKIDVDGDGNITGLF